ncbi:hypothetical protein E2C01_073401 [Portunus trituberculatus]|uniref:Uncharacterized protein n=1 Tax=Portunus trituberculatus TaxID=210409 RepID=A0A5B7IBK9_PORTR|nr:hypothetical protein [Portunus trituberculatus]
MHAHVEARQARQGPGVTPDAVRLAGLPDDIQSPEATAVTTRRRRREEVCWPRGGVENNLGESEAWEKWGRSSFFLFSCK